MKRKILIALALAMLTGTAFAQQNSPGQGNGPVGNGPAGPGEFQGGPGSYQAGPGNCQMSDPGQQLAERLGLDETTAGQVLAIMEEARVQKDAIRETVRAEYCAFRLEIETEMALVLTPEQFELWMTLRNEQERRRGFRGHFGRFDPGLDCNVDS